MADLSLLLDDARAEAKRRGHGVVTPSHVAVVMSQAYPEAARWDEVLPLAERVLDGLPVTYDSPLAMAAVDALGPTLKAGDIAAAAAAVVAALQGPLDPDDGTVTTDAAAGLVIPSAHRGWVAVVPADHGIVGRGSVVDAILDHLDRKQPAPVLLVGEEGSGRTSMAAALAAEKSGVPVIRLDSAVTPSSQRLSAFTEMLRLIDRQAILFIDDLEIALGLGYPSGVDGQVLSLLRPAMDDPRTRIVAVITRQYLARLQGSDRELAEEFNIVELPVLPHETLRAIAGGKAVDIAGYHRVTIPDDVIDASLAPAQDGDLGTHPALAIRRLDVGATRAARRALDVARDVTETVTVADLPIAQAAERRVDPDALIDALRQQIVGQDAAIESVAARLAITVAQLDLNPIRPDGVFLFAGPTGVGKTALALAMARSLFGSDEAVVRIDMSELHDEYTVAKLVGSPPGYIGHDTPDGWLTTQIRRMPRCVLLLDEIEKADPLVWNTFLQVFDAGRLTDLRGATADFREVVIVMTTNLGAEVFSSTGSVGFVDIPTSAATDASSVREILRRTMRPELLNRIDEILVFSPLSPEAVHLIASMRTTSAVEILRARGYEVQATPALMDLIERVGFSKEYGAREVLRTIERLVLQPLAGKPAGAYRPVVDNDTVAWETA